MNYILIVPCVSTTHIIHVGKSIQKNFQIFEVELFFAMNYSFLAIKKRLYFQLEMDLT